MVTGMHLRIEDRVNAPPGPPLLLTVYTSAPSGAFSPL